MGFESPSLRHFFPSGFKILLVLLLLLDLLSEITTTHNSSLPLQLFNSFPIRPKRHRRQSRGIEQIRLRRLRPRKTHRLRFQHRRGRYFHGLARDRRDGRDKFSVRARHGEPRQWTGTVAHQSAVSVIKFHDRLATPEFCALKNRSRTYQLLAVGLVQRQQRQPVAPLVFCCADECRPGCPPNPSSTPSPCS